MGEIMRLVAEAHDVDVSDYVGFRSLAAGRETAALLCRRYTGTTLAKLSQASGLRHPDSSANLVRCAKQREEKSSHYRRQIQQIEAQLVVKTENQV